MIEACLQSVDGSYWQCTASQTPSLDHILTKLRRMLTMLVSIGPGEAVYENLLDDWPFLM
jgi:hypothetical protein